MYPLFGVPHDLTDDGGAPPGEGRQLSGFGDVSEYLETVT